MLSALFPGMSGPRVAENPVSESPEEPSSETSSSASLEGRPGPPDIASFVAAMTTSVDTEALLSAYEDVRSDTTDTEWAVFKFDKQTIVCSAVGTGFDDFRSQFDDDERAFGFIRIQMGDELSKRQKFLFLTWVGPNVSVIKRAKMSIDKTLVKDVVKNFAVELQLESLSDLDQDYFREQLNRAGGADYGTGVRMS